MLSLCICPYWCLHCPSEFTSKAKWEGGSTRATQEQTRGEIQRKAEKSLKAWSKIELWGHHDQVSASSRKEELQDSLEYVNNVGGFIPRKGKTQGLLVCFVLEPFLLM